MPPVLREVPTRAVAPERCSGSVHPRRFGGSLSRSASAHAARAAPSGSPPIAPSRSRSSGPRMRSPAIPAGVPSPLAVPSSDQPRCGDRPACSGPDERQDPVAGQPFRECGGNVLTARAGIAPHGLPVPGTQAESRSWRARALSTRLNRWLIRTAMECINSSWSMWLPQLWCRRRSVTAS